jgi:hypothetical protein
MAHFDDAKELVHHATDTLHRIEKAYSESLGERTIKPKLLIEIKNFMENLRSALDFSAHGLFKKYGVSAKSSPKIYFPYVTLSENKTDFLKKVDSCIPGMSANRPDIVAKLESYQHFSNPANKWLPIFMELNNENKHQKLTPQERKETKELRISSGGVSMSVGDGASISIGQGASIQMGDLIIPGGQSFDARKPAKIIGAGKQEVITWVSFNFSSNNVPVVPMLKDSLSGISAIVNELANL